MVLPLEQAKEALEFSRGGYVGGKIVLAIQLSEKNMGTLTEKLRSLLLRGPLGKSSDLGARQWKRVRRLAHDGSLAPVTVSMQSQEEAAMSISLTIKYKDANREDYNHPFSVQQVLKECWWPLAKRMGLETLQRLECLCITDRDEAIQLLDELKAAQEWLEYPIQSALPAEDSAYMLRRLYQVLPAIEQAIGEWDQVKELSL